MKTVTLKEAVASGKRFRHLGPPLINSHRVATGHVWRISCEAAESVFFNVNEVPIALCCADCGVPISMKIGQPDTWVLEKSDEELEEESLELLNNLGITVREEEKV